jgi:hypothetical protein
MPALRPAYRLQITIVKWKQEDGAPVMLERMVAKMHMATAKK